MNFNFAAKPPGVFVFKGVEQPEPEFASDYQVYCEQSYVGELKKKHIVTADCNLSVSWELGMFSHHYLALHEKVLNTIPSRGSFTSYLVYLHKCRIWNVRTEGSERDLQDDGGGCLAMRVHFGEESIDLFAALPATTTILSQASGVVTGYVNTVSGQPVTPVPVHSLNNISLAENRPDEDDIMDVVDGMESMEVEPSRRYAMPEVMLKLLAGNVGMPELKQLFMFGKNHQKLLQRVYKSGQASEPYCFIDAMVLAAEIGKEFTWSALVQRIEPVEEDGRIVRLVQKDIAWDRDPSGRTYHFYPAATGQNWERIVFLAPCTPRVELKTAECQYRDVQQSELENLGPSSAKKAYAGNDQREAME